MTIIDPHRLLTELRSLPRETEWVEFKINQFDPDDVGQYVSSLANSAILHSEDRGYLVFGVDDTNHEIVGTKVRLKEQKLGNEIFETWLARLLNPRISFELVSLVEDEKHVEILIVTPAYISPIRFKSEAYIRIDSVQKPLRDYPERERAIWAITSRFSFELGIAVTHQSEKQLFERFACKTLINNLHASGRSESSIIEMLVMEGLIIDDKQGAFDIANLFVLLAAKNLREFTS